MALCFVMLSALIPSSAPRGIEGQGGSFSLESWVKSFFGFRTVFVSGPGEFLPTETPPPPWLKNIVPRKAGQKSIVMTWDYRPRTLDEVPDGVNVLAPIWFAVGEQDGKAELQNMEDLGYTNWDPKQYVKKAHEGGAKVWGTVESFTPELSEQFVTDGQRRDDFYRKMSSWVKEYKLDGVCFDFEKMDPANNAAFTDFIAMARQSLPEGTVIAVTVTVPLGYDDPDNWYQCYDRSGLYAAADYIPVMTYDSEEDGVAPIGWMEKKLQLTLEDIPSDKLILGLPFYGREFTTQLDPGEDIASLPVSGSDRKSATFLPSTMQKAIEDGEYTKGDKEIKVQDWVEQDVFNREDMVKEYGFVDEQDIYHQVFLDDAQTIAAKCALVEKYQLPGVGVWRMSYGNDELWQAIANNLP